MDKTEWEQQTDVFKEEFLNEAKRLSSEVGFWTKTGLVVAGAAVLGYFLTKKFSSSGKAESPSANNTPAKPAHQNLSTIARNAIATFLLSLAKEKLLEFLKSPDSGEKPVS